jgi:hypothetical protein
MKGIGKSVPRAEARWRALEAEVVKPCCREKPLSDEPRVTVPQTDTGRRVEYTKANGRTLVKELGKLAP